MPPNKVHDEVISREIVINDADPGVRYKLTKRQTQEEVCVLALFLFTECDFSRISVQKFRCVISLWDSLCMFFGCVSYPSSGHLFPLAEILWVFYSFIF